MGKTFDYITTTDKNLNAKDAIYDATVVANYGDPGLDEDYHADALSRFLICKLESSNRTITTDRYKNMLIVVRRPDDLWISYDGSFINNPINQKRIDANLNSNQGTAANYSINSIPKINRPYALGSKIKVKLIKDDKYSFLNDKASIFSSKCNVWDANSASIGYYANWHNQGLNSNPYIVNNNGAQNILQKTIVPFDDTNTVYGMRLNKTQYEAFLLNIFPEQANSLVSLFNKSSNFDFYYDGNGGYAYSDAFSLDFNFVKYEDINEAKRERVPNVNCVPLIVTTPNSFTVPAARSAGTVNYTPTYITKA